MSDLQAELNEIGSTLDHWPNIVDAARRVATLRLRLAHHLTELEDPCQDRGVDWPCDVAVALGITENTE